MDAVLHVDRTGIPWRWADTGYRTKVIEHGAILSIDVEATRRDTGQKGFKAIPRSWLVERTFGWLMNHRRLARDYETHPHRSEAMIRIVMIDLMSRRLTRESTPNWGRAHRRRATDLRILPHPSLLAASVHRLHPPPPDRPHRRSRTPAATSNPTATCRLPGFRRASCRRCRSVGDVGGKAVRDGPLPAHLHGQVRRPRDLEPLTTHMRGGRGIRNRTRSPLPTAGRFGHRHIARPYVLHSTGGSSRASVLAPTC